MVVLESQSMENSALEVSEEEAREDGSVAALDCILGPPSSSSSPTTSAPPDAPSPSAASSASAAAVAAVDANQVVAAPAQGINATPSTSTELGLGHARASGTGLADTDLSVVAHARCSTSGLAVDIREDHDAAVSGVVPAPAKSSPASVVAASSAAATAAEGDQQAFDGMPCHQRPTLLGVLHVIVLHVIYPVTEEVLRQVFDLFGVVENVHVYRSADCVAAFVKFQSCREAALAREAVHGRCIYDGCCWLDVHFVHSLLTSSAATSSSPEGGGVGFACSLLADQPSGPHEKATWMRMASQSLSWSDLPLELLGLILKRLPSLADRVRVRAVCHPWCSNAWLQPLSPPLPWLALPNGTFLSIPDGEIIQMPVLDDSCCYGSIDNYLFLVHCDGECSLMNPFSEDIIELPSLATICRREMDEYPAYTPVFCKLAVPLPLDLSPESVIAIMYAPDKLCICQPPVLTDRISVREPFGFLSEICFFGGKLYSVDSFGELVIFEIGQSVGSQSKISSIKCIIESQDALGISKPCSREETHIVVPYLVECSGRLLMVRRWVCPMDPRPSHGLDEFDRTSAFEVFEAELSTKPGQWRRVNELGGQALFVGSSCSKSFLAGECSGIRENCIYYMNDYPRWIPLADPLHDSGVYNMRNGEIIPLLSETAAVPQNIDGQWRPTWLFPTQAM